ncbi:hypothetical protein BDZ89DRAFT_1056107, partial [Hymenopellis radicata]
MARDDLCAYGTLITTRPKSTMRTAWTKPWGLNCRDDRAAFPDVGPPLIPMYAYDEEELQALSSSEDLRNEIRPLPAFVSLYIESIRKTKNSKTQDAPAEKGKVKSVLGSMALSHPIVRIPGEQPPIIISDVFLHSIANKMYIPLNWFTNERLELAQHRLHDLHTKLFRPDPTSEGTASDSNRVITFDMLKMTALWGSDSSSTCLSPLQWQEAMKNYHIALVSLAPLPPTSNDPSQLAPPSFAGEFFKHFYFFTNYPNFEATYADWYSFERRARNDIFMGILFDRQFYVNEVDGLRRVKEALMLYAPSPSLKRPSDSDLRNTAKVPRTVNDSPHSFRAGDTAASARTPPSCVACGAPTPFETTRPRPPLSWMAPSVSPSIAMRNSGQVGPSEAGRMPNACVSSSTYPQVASDSTTNHTKNCMFAACVDGSTQPSLGTRPAPGACRTAPPEH